VRRRRGGRLRTMRSEVGGEDEWLVIVSSPDGRELHRSRPKVSGVRGEEGVGPQGRG